jgi:SPP1 family predicted phage head-tail adaptor
MAEYELFFKKREGRDNSMNERIRLITVSRTLSNGHYTNTESSAEVWAEVKSVTRSEFYQAYAAGLNAAVVFRVYTEELGAAEYVEYGGRRYKIQRTYRVDALHTEVTAGELEGRASSTTAQNAATETQSQEAAAGEIEQEGTPDGTAAD